MNRANKKATIGKNRDSNDMTTEPPDSTVETTGFAIPPVVAVDDKRNNDTLPLIAEAVPPPAMIAKAHVKTGFISPSVATITTVPAIPAKGIANVSKILSIQGM